MIRRLFKMHTAPLHHPKATFHFIISSSTLLQPFLANPQEKVMDFSQVNHNHKQPKRKQSPNKRSHEKRLTQEQVRVLERSFVLNKRLDPERKLQLAGELEVPPRQVAIWYQNRRARWKTQTLELDHSSLQLRLESALEEKEKLQKDVEFLRGELRRAQDLILLLKNRENNPSSSSSLFSMVSSFNNCAVSTDEGGNGNYEDAVMNCCWVDDDDAAMWGEDLYACFMLNNGSSMD